MMNALISGQTGMAFLIVGTDIQLVTIDDVDQSRGCSPGSVSHLLNQATDVVELRDTSRKDALKTLNQLWNYDRCLGAFYIALDKCAESSADHLVSDELFIEALAVLNELASGDATMTSAINTLSGYPFPNPGALETAEKLATGYPKALQVITEIKRHQPAIARLYHCWTQLPDTLFTGEKSRDDFRLALIGAGIWRGLAVAIEDYGEIQLLRMKAVESLGGFPKKIQVLNQWFAQFTPQRESKDISALLEKESKREWKDPGKDRKAPSRNYASEEEYQHALEQVDIIRGLIFLGDQKKAYRSTKKLVDYQMAHGGAEHAAKSLCAIAQAAKETSDYSLQLELTQWAVKLAPKDGWAHSQLAEAFVSINQLDNAMRSLIEAENRGEAAFARAGFARIYRLQGRLEKAKEAYEDLMSEDAESTVFCGLAEVHREMWDFPNAISAYELAVEKFPEDPIPRTGLANVVLDAGDPERAKALFLEVLTLFEKRAYAFNGLAKAHLKMGEIEEAKKVYREAMEKFPKNHVAFCGFAETLRNDDQLETAEAQYQTAVDRFPYSPVPFNGLGAVLKDMGRFDEAIKVYEQCISKFPYDRWAFNGRASTHRRAGQYQDSLRFYDESITTNPYDYVARHGRIFLLKGMGRFDEALNELDPLLQRFSNQRMAQNSKAGILMALERYEEAEALLFSDTPRTKDEWVSHHIGAMIQIRRGNLDEGVKLLEYGLESVPFYRVGEVYRNSMAIAHLRREKVDAAIEIMEGASIFANVITLHAEGLKGNKAKAQMALNRIQRRCPPVIEELSNEIAAQYGISGNQAAHNLEWVFNQECNGVVLLAAA